MYEYKYEGFKYPSQMPLSPGRMQTAKCGYHIDARNAFPHNRPSFPKKQKVQGASCCNIQILKKKKKKKKGVALIVKHSLNITSVQHLADPTGRGLIVVCQINQQQYTLVNVYSRNTNQIEFLKQVLEQLANIQRGTLIIGGDFNSILDPYVDRSPQAPELPKTYHKIVTRKAFNFTKLLAQNNLYDVLNPTAKDYTYYSQNHKSYTRIDLFLVHPQTQKNIPHSNNTTWTDLCCLSVPYSACPMLPVCVILCLPYPACVCHILPALCCLCVPYSACPTLPECAILCLPYAACVCHTLPALCCLCVPYSACPMLPVCAILCLPYAACVCHTLPALCCLCVCHTLPALCCLCVPYSACSMLPVCVILYLPYAACVCHTLHALCCLCVCHTLPALCCMCVSYSAWPMLPVCVSYSACPMLPVCA
uniref:Endonuclease/exonuclease/phosphatase domain-containing protein n=1 Tax=Xenopus tropicalis TaxID=8364 RepID=A0A803JMY4_XENTR